MQMLLSHNIILPKYLGIVKEKGSRMSKTRAREGGASVFTALFSSFRISAPPSARKKIWPSNQAGEKEGGWGEGIFARLFCAVGAVGWEAFPPFGIKPNIKAKQFSIPFKRKKGARKIQKIERKLFCFARRNSAGRKRWGGSKSQNLDFRQKKFGFCPKGTANLQFQRFWGLLPRPRYARARLPPLFWREIWNPKTISARSNGSSSSEARAKRSFENQSFFFRLRRKAKR